MDLQKKKKEEKEISLIEALKSGNWKNLIAMFLYFDTGFTAWLLFGPALGIFISQELNLKPAYEFFMAGVPLLIAAILRIPFGYMLQAINGKWIAVMGILISMIPPIYLNIRNGTPTLEEIIILGSFLAFGGASFAVALPMAGSTYPKKYQGIVLGIAAAGNLGAVLDGLIFPPLAKMFGWKLASLAAIAFLLITLVLVLAWGEDRTAKKPELKKHSIFVFVSSYFFTLIIVFGLYFIVNWLINQGQISPVKLKTMLLILPFISGGFTLFILPKVYRVLLRERDMLKFILIYSITFGGFVGMSAGVAFILKKTYGFSPVTAGTMMSLLALTGALIRPVGGYIADKIGGVKVLMLSLTLISIFNFSLAFTSYLPQVLGISLLFGLFASYGLGNGATFQLVPLRWPLATGITTGIIGSAGGLGGFILSQTFGLIKEGTGSFDLAYIIFGFVALFALTGLIILQKEWNEWAIADSTETTALGDIKQESKN
ncbi:MFS transporter [Sulfurihydrogenibium sp.]|uniref:MFS transporter n=1 Tax=Sulfurihydrogenibium sp. TaxID=2053621 RepID=UPI002622CC32|nr:MFS transporter [Sulfurihydrogenibium sp.]